MPATITPRPPPTPSTLARRAMPWDTRPGRSSSRTMAYASGSTPPLTPWTTRPATSAAIDGMVHSSVPSATMTSTATSTRRLPSMSPSRPAIGVATAELSRKAVTVQLAASGEAPSERWIAGSAGITSDCINEYVNAARASTARTPRSPAARGPRRVTRYVSGVQLLDLARLLLVDHAALELHGLRHRLAPGEPGHALEDLVPLDLLDPGERLVGGLDGTVHLGVDLRVARELLERAG